MKIVVAMSGGVDSSVCALLLKNLGYEVIGVFMKNWEGDEHCNASLDFEDVARVCEKIQIPYYSVNFAEEYKDKVFDFFLEELKKGNTPNPDILCNREIKFQVLLQKSLQFGDKLATGHYCQTKDRLLLKGADLGKDQSYFLYTLKESILDHVLFPIGHLTKSEVRAIARAHGLPTAEKKDSTGICFIGKRDFKTFIKQYIPYQMGDFISMDGKKVGRHDGVAYYTIGQRKGLGIGGAGDAWFVVKKDVDRNVIYVAQGEDHPALYAKSLTAINPSYVSNAPTYPFRCKAKIRYRQEDQGCVVDKKNGVLHVLFDQPQRAITSRQSIVFYQDDLCLGGAIIEEKGD